MAQLVADRMRFVQEHPTTILTLQQAVLDPDVGRHLDAMIWRGQDDLMERFRALSASGALRPVNTFVCGGGSPRQHDHGPHDRHRAGRGRLGIAGPLPPEEIARALVDVLMNGFGPDQKKKESAMSNEITPSDFSEIRWRGNWIWLDPPPQGRFFPGAGGEAKRPEVRGLFRKAPSLDRIPYVCRLASLPTRGDSALCQRPGGLPCPIRSQPRRLTYDLFDLAPYLRGDMNSPCSLYTTARRVPSGSRPWPAAPWGRNGVLVFEANLGPSTGAQDGWLVSETTWKTLKSDAWTEDWKKAEEMPPMFADAIPTEVVDARRLPFGWGAARLRRPRGNAHLIGPMHPGSGGRSTPPSDPYGPLHPRPIGRLGGDCALPWPCVAKTWRVLLTRTSATRCCVCRLPSRSL